MINTPRFISALGAVFFVSVTLAACGGGIPSNAVVNVGGTPISKSTYQHWLAIAASSNAASVPGQTAPKPVIPDPPDFKACIAHLEATAPKPAKGQSKPTAATLKTECEQQYTALKSEVLGFLIQANWLIGEAKEQGVSVSDKEVEKQFETLKKQQFPKEENFTKFLASTGQTVSDLLLRIKINSLGQKLEQKVTKNAKKTPTEAEVAKYYEEHKSQYGQAEKANLALVLTKGEAEAKKAKSEIESGASFATVAKKSSIDPVSKAKGGKLEGVSKGQEEAAFDKAIFSAKVGTLVGPIKTPFGFYVFKVEKLTPGTQQALSAVKATVKQTIAASSQQKSLSAFIKEFQKNWKAKTECRSEYLVADCKSYKAPKTASPLTAPTTAPTTATPQTQTGTTVTATVSTSKTK